MVVNHVVMFSSGIGSWAAAKRVVAEFGAQNTKLLFMDTKIEDDDNYRFLYEAAANTGAELVVIEDGRTPFEVFRDVKFMGNSRIDPCSRLLKRELADKWIADNYTPDTVVVHVGIDWTEEHRFTRLSERKKPWVYQAPLTKPPYLMKDNLLAWARSEGLEPPRMYAMGFQHANCGGFCIKSGQAQFELLHKHFPERYIEMEAREQEVFEAIGVPRPFIRKTENGQLRYMSMREFRQEVLEPKCEVDKTDWGGCGCFVDDWSQQELFADA